MQVYRREDLTIIILYKQCKFTDMNSVERNWSSQIFLMF